MRGLLTRVVLTAPRRRRPRPRSSSRPPYADTTCRRSTRRPGKCLIWIEVPGTPGTPGEPGDDGPKDTGTGAACYWDGTDQGHHASLRPGRCPAHRPHGYWSNGYHCYIRPFDPQPPAGDPSWQGHEPGDGAVYNCYQPQTGLLITSGRRTRRPDSGTGPTPREVAQIAIDQMKLSAINIGIAPEPGPDSIGLVGMPVWMWAKDPNDHTVRPDHRERLGRRHHDHGDREGPARSPGTWATAPRSSATRRARRTSRRTGGRTPPTAATPTRSRARTRPDDAYTVTATSSWVITWSGAGQTGTIRLDGLNRSTQIRIGEAQVLVN